MFLKNKVKKIAIINYTKLVVNIIIGRRIKKHVGNS